MKCEYNVEAHKGILENRKFGPLRYLSMTLNVGSASIPLWAI